MASSGGQADTWLEQADAKAGEGDDEEANNLSDPASRLRGARVEVRGGAGGRGREGAPKTPGGGHGGRTFGVGGSFTHSAPAFSSVALCA